MSKKDDYLEKVRQSAAAAEGGPSWKTAGILLSEENFETSQAPRPRRSRSPEPTEAPAKCCIEGCDGDRPNRRGYCQSCWELRDRCALQALAGLHPRSSTTDQARAVRDAYLTADLMLVQRLK